MVTVRKFPLICNVLLRINTIHSRHSTLFFLSYPMHLKRDYCDLRSDCLLPDPHLMYSTFSCNLVTYVVLLTCIGQTVRSVSGYM